MLSPAQTIGLVVSSGCGSFIPNIPDAG